MLWNRDEYIAHMLFEDIGREMFIELFGPLHRLKAEWTRDQVPPDELNLSAFGWDAVNMIWVECNTGLLSGKTKNIYLDNDRERLLIDEYGRRCRLCKDSATLPLPMDYPVKTEEDWMKIKHWYTFREERINKEQLELAKKRRKEGALVLAWIPGGFDEPRQLMGEEELCVAFYENPEMIQDMLETMADTSLKVFERVLDYVPIDNLCIHEDMAGKSGPLMGPNLISKFLKPYYRKVWDTLSMNGTKLFSQDSDGNMDAVIDAFLDCGVNVMFPFEPAAGMDMVRTRQKYGKKLAIKGGIDKHALRGSKEDIRKELEYRMCDEMQHGGTIFGLDHLIPNGVPIENYRYYVRLGRELLHLPQAEKSPFIGMAF